MKVYFEITYAEMNKINEKILYLTANIKKIKLFYAMMGFVLSFFASIYYLTMMYVFFVSLLVGLFIYVYGAKQLIKFQNFLTTFQIKERFPRSYSFSFNKEHFIYERQTSPKTAYKIPWSNVSSAAEFDDFYLLYVKQAGKVFVLKKTITKQSEMKNELFQEKLNDLLLKKGLL